MQLPSREYEAPPVGTRRLILVPDRPGVNEILIEFIL